MAIQGEHILAIGDKPSVLEVAGSGHQIVDLDKKTVLPGFIDPHFHLISSSATPIFENVGLDRFEAVEDLLGYQRQWSKLCNGTEILVRSLGRYCKCRKPDGI